MFFGEVRLMPELGRGTIRQDEEMLSSVRYIIVLYSLENVRYSNKRLEH